MKESHRKYRPLTTVEINNFKPRDKVYKMGHGGGLYIMVYPNGNKLWGMKYYVDGKERRTSFGAWPQVTIVEAQKKRDEIKELLAHGIDPSRHKKEAKERAKLETTIAQNTFQSVANDWLNSYGKDLVATRFIKLRRYLENELFPAFGHKPVTEIMPVDILAVAEKKQEGGKVYTAHRLTQLAGQILQYAFIKGLVPTNVGRGITAALQPVRHKNFSTITNPKEIRLKQE